MFDHGSWMLEGLQTTPLTGLAPFFPLFTGLKNFFGNRPPSARELLDRAHARGELSRDEYLK